MQQEIELSVEKSQRQADLINVTKIPLSMLDIEYCQELAKQMVRQARMQDTLSVLAPHQPLEKNKILAMKGHALKTLTEYVQQLKEVTEMEMQINKRLEMQNEIGKAFV